MLAGAAKIDITPTGEVWMDGMIRAHRSTGIHDPLFARALVLANSEDLREAHAVVSIDVIALTTEDGDAARRAVAAGTGIGSGRVILAGTHTHSGPAMIGDCSPPEGNYIQELTQKLTYLVQQACGSLRAVAVGCGSGREETISHYRRLLADDGHVVMNWELYPAEHIVGPLGVIDPEVGVLKVVAAEDADEIVCLLFNHAGHPNVLSGENYLLSAEYPGLAARLLEEEFGGTAVFVNGAQGTMDIDGLKDRDWEGMERAGRALAQAVADTARAIVPPRASVIRGSNISYVLPSRKITKEEWAWAEEVLERTGGTIQPLADGVGDDYKATLYKELREGEGRDFPVEQNCFAVCDSAFISFPGELYTEIGMHIKAESPFEHTYIIGLANGYVGYVPTRKAIAEGGYAEDTRHLDAAAEEMVVEQSLALLRKVYRFSEEE